MYQLLIACLTFATLAGQTQFLKSYGLTRLSNETEISNNASTTIESTSSVSYKHYVAYVSAI